jgi:hypothetical protein
VDYKNIDGFIGSIIAEKQATLDELRTVYSLEDAFILWEIISIRKYNEWLAAEYARKKAEAKR